MARWCPEEECAQLVQIFRNRQDIQVLREAQEEAGGGKGTLSDLQQRVGALEKKRGSSKLSASASKRIKKLEATVEDLQQRLETTKEEHARHIDEMQQLFETKLKEINEMAGGLIGQLRIRVDVAETICNQVVIALAAPPR